MNSDLMEANNMAKKEKREKKKPEEDLDEFLKSLPPPPEEHAYELKMEKRLKRMLEKEEEKAKQRRVEANLQNWSSIPNARAKRPMKSNSRESLKCRYCGKLVLPKSRANVFCTKECGQDCRLENSGDSTFDTILTVTGEGNHEFWTRRNKETNEILEGCQHKIDQ